MGGGSEVGEMKHIEVAQIAVDASTQTRASISEPVVTDYAEKMLNGAQFPAIVLFHDGNHYYIGDGFHRVLASQRNGAVTVASDVRPGTREDALWFALGANREHGHQMTKADKKHAVIVAVQTFPNRTQTEMANQIGCTQGFVSQVISANNLTRPGKVAGKDGKSYPATHEQPARPQSPLRQKIADMTIGGASSKAVREATGASQGTIADVRKQLGVAGLSLARDAVSGRLDAMKQMAEAGHTSRQIAEAVGMNENSCREKLRTEGIDVPADRSTRNLHRHDANRIVEHIVMDAENLTADVNLIEFDKLDRERLGDWIDGLTQSRRGLDAFIKRLIKTKDEHVEAA